MAYSLIYRGYDIIQTDRGFEVKVTQTVMDRPGTYIFASEEGAMNAIDGWKRQQRMDAVADAREKERNK